MAARVYNKCGKCSTVTEITVRAQHKVRNVKCPACGMTEKISVEHKKTYNKTKGYG